MPAATDTFSDAVFCPNWRTYTNESHTSAAAADRPSPSLPNKKQTLFDGNGFSSTGRALSVISTPMMWNLFFAGRASEQQQQHTHHNGGATAHFCSRNDATAACNDAWLTERMRACVPCEPYLALSSRPVLPAKTHSLTPNAQQVRMIGPTFDAVRQRSEGERRREARTDSTDSTRTLGEVEEEYFGNNTLRVRRRRRGGHIANRSRRRCCSGFHSWNGASIVVAIHSERL